MPRILALYYDPLANGQRMSARYRWVALATGLTTALEQLNGAMAGSGISYTMDMQEIAIPALTRRTYQSQHVDHVDSTPPVYLSPEEWVGYWDRYAVPAPEQPISRAALTLMPPEFTATPPGNGVRFTGTTPAPAPTRYKFSPSQWPSGGEIHIKAFFANNDIIRRVNADEIDEVWTAGLPIPACFEGAMVCPDGDMGAYPTHDTVIKVPGLTRRFVWHMFSIENWNPLHNYWHRIESIMARIWAGPEGDPGYGVGYAEQWSPPRSMDTIKTPWQHFTMTDNERPGEGQGGSCHFPTNAKLGYVYDMEDVVPSGAHLWKDYPNGFPLDLSRMDRFQMVSVEDWRGRPDYVWQFEHIPRAPLMFGGRWANWWKYITDVNEQTGRNTVRLSPWMGTPPPLPGAVTEYPSLGRALIRWSPRDGDSPDAVYEVRTDGVLDGVLRRRGAVHTKMSLDVAIAQREYSVHRLLDWTETYPRNGPVPPTPEPGGTMLSISEVQSLIEAVHTTQGGLAGCPRPSRYSEDASNVYVHWDGAGGTTLTVQKRWLPPNVGQFYQLLYPKVLCGTVIEPPVVVPPVEPPSVKLTIPQLTQMVNVLHTLPALVNCPKPTYTETQGVIYLHWPGQPTMQIDKDWTGAQIKAYYPAMYPKSVCGGIVDPPPVVVPPTPPPGTSFDVRPLVDTMISGQEAMLTKLREYRNTLP